jgi:glycosyltransferase involved in cell wall biosynthesis
MSMNENNKILIVADVDWWVFKKIYINLKKNLINWDINIHYTSNSYVIPHDDYDIILFLCDYQIEVLERNKIPREKVILAIRSDVNQSFYNNKENVMKIAKFIAVSNIKIKERFEKLHDNVILAPGGVDTDKFVYKKKSFTDNIRVGWAGRLYNFGGEFRGIPIIDSACKKLGYHFNPAFQEKRFRIEDEMVEYYHNEIDIYVDMSITAGRQNGILEAGSCGVPIISSSVGISESLIKHGESGLLCDRNVESLCKCLKQIIIIAEKCSINLRKTIEEMWSWEIQSKIFDNMFNKIINV